MKVYKQIAVQTILFLLFIVLPASATPVTQQRAAKAAETFIVLAHPAIEKAIARTVTPFDRSQLKVRQVRPLIQEGRLIGFIADLKPSGFVLLSADDDAPPVKLHSDSSSWEDLPASFLKIIETELSGDLMTLEEMKKQKRSVAPKHSKQWLALSDPVNQPASLSTLLPPNSGNILTTTAWNQVAPFNYYCPMIGGSQAYAGCSACTLAQIMRFYAQPRIVAKNHTDSNNSACSIYDTGPVDYDWANMQDYITTSSTLAQKQAVGQLIYHAAVALDSMFQFNSTAARSSDVPAVLQTYFGYSCGGYEQKAGFTDSQWYQKIVTDIDASRPIYYSLDQSDGSEGHAAVCDGYQSGNEIHLNLGWSGAGNEVWYTVDSVAPSQADWGASNPPVWTIHGAVFGITPPLPTITAISPSTLSPSPNAKTITITGLNFSAAGAPNGSTIELYDPANNATSITPINITPNSLQANVTVQTAGQWEVQVVNGTQLSPIFTFTVAPSIPQLVGLSVSGPANVIQNSGGNQFTATAIMSDGSTPTVTPTWSLSLGAPASISSTGQLTANGVGANTAITLTATYIYGGITKIANYGVTISPTANCGSYVTNSITNGDFETGTAAPWVTSVGAIVSSVDGFAYLGSYYLWLGGDNGTDTAYQTITIPSSATSATLSFYCNINSSEPTSFGAYDTFNATIRDTSGNLLTTVGNWSNLNGTSPGKQYYFQESFNLLSYTGRTIRVYFVSNCHLANNQTTNFRVDGVSVISSVPNPVVPALFGIGGPTSVAQGSTAQYNAVEVYCNNSVASVTANWSISSGPATISSSGILTPGSVSANTPATVTGIYNGARVDYPITIVHIAPVIVSLALNGQSSMSENSAAQFTAQAIYSDGSSQPASPIWSVSSGLGNISASGLLTVGQIGASSTTIVTAGLTVGGGSWTASQSIALVKGPSLYAIAPLSGTGGAISPSTGFVVNSGDDQTFTAYPDATHVVDQWLVDGNVVQAGGANYVLSSIQTNHNVEVTFDSMQSAPRTIMFAGEQWSVRTGTGNPGGITNNWSNDPSNVWVDASGQLHLMIREVGGTWYCSEIDEVTPTHYGMHRFYVASNIDQLQSNVVFSPFLYKDDTNEIDIEFSKTVSTTGSNAQYVVQPSSASSSNLLQFSLTLSNGNYSTHYIDWEPSGIHFKSFYGHYQEPPLGNLIEDYTYFGTNNPSDSLGLRTIINLYFENSIPPTNDVEVILTGADLPQPFQIISIKPVGQDVVLGWIGPAGSTCTVQSTEQATGSFTDLSSLIVFQGFGDVATNYIDSGAITNARARFYRIRQMWGP